MSTGCISRTLKVRGGINFPGEQISGLFLLLPENLCASNYSGAAYCAYLLLHMSPPGLSPGVHSIGDKQRALQQGLADKEKRHILQKLTQIGGVQRYKDELRQALAGT